MAQLNNSNVVLMKQCFIEGWWGSLKAHPYLRWTKVWRSECDIFSPLVCASFYLCIFICACICICICFVFVCIYMHSAVCGRRRRGESPISGVDFASTLSPLAQPFLLLYLYLFLFVFVFTFLFIFVFVLLYLSRICTVQSLGGGV